MGDREPPNDLRLWKQPDRWLHHMEFLQNHTPSRKVGITYEEENHWLQLLCQLCQDIGTKIEVSQLVINTACVYLRRMFLYTDLRRFNRVQPYLQVAAATALFLAAKVEEKPRKLEHVIQWKNRLCGTHLIQNRAIGNTQQEKELNEITSCLEDYKRLECCLLKLLGFDVTVDHPHTHVVKACQMFNASTDFAQTAYFMATNALQMTNLCLMYSPATIAGACIYVAFKWSRIKMFPSHEGMEWYHYVDKSLTEEKLKSMAKIMMDTFAKYPDVVQRVLNPQKHKEEQGRGRRFRLEGFLSRLADSTPVIPRNPSLLSLPGPSHEGSSSHPGSSHSGSHSGSSGASATVTRPTPESSRSHTSGSHRDQRTATATRPHVYMQRGDHRLSTVKTEPSVVVTNLPAGCPSVSMSMSDACHAVTHTTTVHHSSVAASAKGHSQSSTRSELQEDDQHAKQGAASQGSNHPSTKKLSLQDYHQRVEQRVPPLVQVKSEPAPVFPMHPMAAKLGQSGLAKSSHSHQSYSHHSQPKKLPHPLLLPTKETSCLRDHSEHPQLPERPPVPPPQGLELQQIQDGLKSLEAGAVLGKGGKQQTSPVKIIKREGLFSSVPNNVHLKEAKVLVQDLKDSHGQEKMLYNNAEACRKRSFSQSMEEEVEGARHTPSKQGESAPKYTKLSQEKGQYNHSGEPVRPKTQPPVEGHQDLRKMALSSRHKSPKMESSGSATPIKLHIKRNAGKLHVKNHEESSPTPPPAKSSPLKVKIRMTPEVGSLHSAIVSSPAEQEEGLKLRLAMPVGGSIRSHDKTSHLSKAAAAAEGQERERRHKHGMHSQTGQSQHHSSRDRSGHRSSVPQMALPTLSGDGSQQGKCHSQPPLQSQYSGFTFTDHFITPNLPDTIFEPDTPTDLNGGFGAPETPTTDNMSRVNAHMQHLYAQSAGQHGAMYPFHPGLMNNVGMRPSSQPPLPPPLPDNPPPPPPPPPQ